MCMAMIFLGMDPYLEDPVLWTGVHASLIVYIGDQLQPLLLPRYVAAIGERVFVEGPQEQRIPDVWVKRLKESRGRAAVLEADPAIVVEVPELEVHESYVTILDRHAGQKLVTLIEVVSPTNKVDGPGRESYEAKQEEVRGSSVHLVEIDLLRAGQHVLAVAEWKARDQGAYHYLACVNRAQRRRTKFDLYPRALPDRLPKIAIPLAGKDRDVVLDVQAALEQTYEHAGYAYRIDYSVPCPGPLSPEDEAWVRDTIRNARVQTGNGKRRARYKARGQ